MVKFQNDDKWYSQRNSQIKQQTYQDLFNKNNEEMGKLLGNKCKAFAEWKNKTQLPMNGIKKQKHQEKGESFAEKYRGQLERPKGGRSPSSNMLILTMLKEFFIFLKTVYISH